MLVSKIERRYSMGHAEEFHVGQTFLSAAARPQRWGSFLIPVSATSGFAAADRNVCPTGHYRALMIASVNCVVLAVPPRSRVKVLPSTKTVSIALRIREAALVSPTDSSRSNA